MSEAGAALDFTVRRDDWRQCRLVPAKLPEELEDGRVLLRVDRFALTANNITYAMMGDTLGYWKFFPAAQEGWGRIPAMGFGDVIRSAHPDVREGERVFGFFPMSTHLVIQAKADASGISDAAEHRAESAPAYRQYTRVAADPLYDPKSEDRLMLLRGLFLTSFLIDDFMAEHDFFGAGIAVVASASSKTAIALAHLLARRGRPRVIGLTSPGNADFVNGLGCYDDVVDYDTLDALPERAPAVFVDMAGDGKLLGAVHEHFGEDLRYSCIVGATHWKATRRPKKLAGPEPTLFFAPAQLQKRSAEWGPGGLQERLGEAWRGFLAASGDWMRVVRAYGPEAVERIYREILDGRAKPSEGHVLSLWDQ